MVQDALSSLMKGRTTLVIAHRLSTIKEADEIIVLQNGQIVERGHHSDLVEIDGGVYKKLTEMQQIA
jgi:subfamily B ATP-binding cassette protein MsbA